MYRLLNETLNTSTDYKNGDDLLEASWLATSLNQKTYWVRLPIVDDLPENITYSYHEHLIRSIGAMIPSINTRAGGKRIPKRKNDIISIMSIIVDSIVNDFLENTDKASMNDKQKQAKGPTNE